MFTCYQPRRVTFLGTRTVAGYQLKVYSICRRDDVFDGPRFEQGLPLAVAALPQPPITAQRPGAGFVIFHQGATGDYIVLCWWDRENELPMRILVRQADHWRPSNPDESCCVWDLRIMWFEREQYVHDMLADRPDGLSTYLHAAFEGWA